MIQTKILLMFFLLALASAEIIFSQPRSSQVSADGSITLSARIIQSNPSNFIRQAKFELLSNGKKVSERTIRTPGSGGIWSITVEDLAAGQEYCFQVEARDRFNVSSTSRNSCFSVAQRKYQAETEQAWSMFRRRKKQRHQHHLFHTAETEQQVLTNGKPQEVLSMLRRRQKHESDRNAE